MASKAFVALGLAAVVGVTAVIARSSQSQSVKPLSAADIIASVNLDVLDANYQIMNDLLLFGQISRVAYDQLYAAYVTRFYQLIGG